MMRDNRSDSLPVNNPYWSTLGKKRHCPINKSLLSDKKIRDVLKSPKQFSTSSFVQPVVKDVLVKPNELLSADGPEASQSTPVANTPAGRHVHTVQKSFCTSTLATRRNEEPITSKEEKDPQHASSEDPSSCPLLTAIAVTGQCDEQLGPIPSSLTEVDTRIHPSSRSNELEGEHDKVAGEQIPTESFDQIAPLTCTLESLGGPSQPEHVHSIASHPSFIQNSPQLETKANVSLASFLNHHSPAYQHSYPQASHEEQYRKTEKASLRNDSLSSKKESLSVTLHGKRDEARCMPHKWKRSTEADGEASLATFFMEPEIEPIPTAKHPPIGEMEFSKRSSINSKPSVKSTWANKRVSFSGGSRDTASSENDSKMQASRSSTCSPSSQRSAVLPPSLQRFSSKERSLKDQINSLTRKGRNCLAMLRQQWDSDHHPMPGHIYICVARFCGFNLAEGRKLLSQFDERYLRLTVSHLEPQLLTQTIFPVPGLKSIQGLDMFFMRPALFYPKYMKTQTIVDNLAYVMLSMVEQEEAATNGIGVVIYMNEFTMENFSAPYWRHLMQMLQGGVPARIGLVLIVNAPSCFEAVWKPMKRELPVAFQKKIKMIKERMLYQALAPGYQAILPDETAIGSADTTEMVKDYVSYRKFVEAKRSKPKDW